jgi:hypothetical protein
MTGTSRLTKSMVLLFALGWMLSGCASNSSVPKLPGEAAIPAPTPAGAVAQGIWGGEHAQLQVGDTAASLQLDCAHGTTDQPLQAAANGEFDATGTIVFEAGPEPSTGRAFLPATYHGLVEGGQMQLTVSYVDGGGGTVSSTYQLTEGQSGHLVRCAGVVRP